MYTPCHNSYVKLHVDVTSCNRIGNTTNYWLFDKLCTSFNKLYSQVSGLQTFDIDLHPQNRRHKLEYALCKSHTDNTTWCDAMCESSSRRRVVTSVNNLLGTIAVLLATHHRPWFVSRHNTYTISHAEWNKCCSAGMCGWRKLLIRPNDISDD